MATTRDEALVTPTGARRLESDETYPEDVVRPTSTPVSVRKQETASPTVKVEDRHDQVRWGPVWAGTLTTITSFLVLELAFFSLGILTLSGDPSPDTNSGAWMTGLAGLIAFVLGGMIAAATSMWRGLSSGLVNGLGVWVLTVSTMVLLTLLGGGALFGALSESFGQIASLPGTGGGSGGASSGALETARSTAGTAVLTLLGFLAAALLGGLLGAKMWPRKDKENRTTVHTDDSDGDGAHTS